MGIIEPIEICANNIHIKCVPCSLIYTYHNVYDKIKVWNLWLKWKYERTRRHIVNMAYAKKKTIKYVSVY